MATDQLDDLRAAIDGIDDGLVELLARRRVAVEALALRKREAGLPGFDPRREDDLRARWRAAAHARALPDEVALAVLEAILGVSRRRVQAVAEGDASAGGAGAPPAAAGDPSRGGKSV